MPSACQKAINRKETGKEVWPTESAQLFDLVSARLFVPHAALCQFFSSFIQSALVFIVQDKGSVKPYFLVIKPIYVWNTGFFVDLNFFGLLQAIQGSRIPSVVTE